jgi:capsular exopolysaccharide synthesis family protein
MRNPNSTGRDQTVELLDYVAVLRRQFLLIAISMTVGLVLALVYTLMKTPTYTATAEVLVQPPTSNDAGLRIDQLISLETEVRLVTSAPIAQLAREELDTSRSIAELLRHVGVESSADTYVLDVLFTDLEPQAAARGANAFAQAYLDYKTDRAQEEIDLQREGIENQLIEMRLRERELRRVLLDSNPGSLAALDAQESLDDLQVQFTILTSQLANIPTFVDPGDVILPATAPRSASSPNLVLNMLAGAFLGLFIGVVIGFVRDRADDRIRGRADLPSVLAAPVLAYVPRIARRSRDLNRHRLVVEEEPRGAAAEAYRTMRTSVLAIGRRREAKVIAIVSPGEQEGKSTTAANLAVTIAHSGQRVAIVCADLRRPRVHSIFDVPNEHGLSELLAGEIEFDEALKGADIVNLSVLPGGQTPARPAELLQSQAMAAAIDDLRGAFDLVILDCPPILGLSDCLAIVPLADATIMVVEAERTRSGAIVDAIEQLDHVGVAVEGVVLNAVRTGRGGHHHAYGYFLAAPRHLDTRSTEGVADDTRSVAALQDRRQGTNAQEHTSPRQVPLRRATGSSDDDA